MRKTLYVLLILVVAGSFAMISRVSGLGPKDFPHKKHIDGGVECATCHPEAQASEDLKHGLLPTIKTCTSDCHEQAELKTLGWGKIEPRHSGLRSFPHKSHLEGGMECTDCHDPALPFMGLKAPSLMPNHGICMQCHDGVAQTDECEECHTNLREDRLSGLQYDPALFKPFDHHPGFMDDHQFQVRLNGTECSECHRQEDFCSECHQGEGIDVVVHERNWLYTHPVAARKGLTDCIACHEIGTFCTECHMEYGVEPGDHAAAGWKTSLHPEAARRDIQLCASCHDDDADFVCSGCHRDTGGQGDQPHLNIHPDGFKDDITHGYWHDDPGAACFACHTRPAQPRPGVGFCGYCHGTNPGD